ARGYAEADPSGDVEGRDAAHKLVLLVRLSFGAWPQPSGVRRVPAALEGEGQPGITGVSAAEISAAADHGLTIKLIASAGRPGADGGSRLEGWVEPCAVARRSLLGSTDGVTNSVEVSGRPVGRVSFQGPGAGGDATSSAVLADLLALARGEGATWAALPEAPPLGELDAGHGSPVRWFYLTAAGGQLSEPVTLAELRARLRGTDVAQATLYRCLEAD
ncbi:MAG: hypothetical protein M3253_03280, partial [Chloroflexota bacterium]|nr:hypothetical protein [Chloroflexota bacterium]